MANTYTLIASNTLSTTAASVTFSSIPSTYTDLVLKFSVRNSGTNTSTVRIRFNATATNYSYTYLQGDGSAATSSRASATTFIFTLQNRNSYTANTFSSNEIYLPSYTAAQNKPLSVIGMQEDNSTAITMQATAGLWSNTAAVSEIEISTDANNFVSGSSFWLYGIKAN